MVLLLIISTLSFLFLFFLKLIEFFYSCSYTIHLVKKKIIFMCCIKMMNRIFPHLMQPICFFSLVNLLNFKDWFLCYVQVAVAVLVSWLIFRNPISGLNAVGCAITLVGCTFYGYVRHMLSQQPSGTPQTPRTPRNRIELLPLVNDKIDDKVWCWDQVECGVICRRHNNRNGKRYKIETSRFVV